MEAIAIPVVRIRIYFIPKNLPNLLRRPERVRGIPVAREILRFAAVTPRARFHENVSPGPSFIVVHDIRTEANQIRSTIFQEEGRT
jgi:hypothetical protein